MRIELENEILESELEEINLVIHNTIFHKNLEINKFIRCLKSYNFESIIYGMAGSHIWVSNLKKERILLITNNS